MPKSLLMYVDWEDSHHEMVVRWTSRFEGRRGWVLASNSSGGGGGVMACFDLPIP
jgi:hypothetical protein